MSTLLMDMEYKKKFAIMFTKVRECLQTLQISCFSKAYFNKNAMVLTNIKQKVNIYIHHNIFESKRSQWKITYTPTHAILF